MPNGTHWNEASQRSSSSDTQGVLRFAQHDSSNELVYKTLNRKHHANWPDKYLAPVIAGAALIIFFLLALQTAVALAPTADEGMHLLRGQILRETGDLSYQGQHTPLSHWLIGTLYFTADGDLPVVSSLPSWSAHKAPELVQEFLWQSGLNVERLLFLGRLPIIFAGLILGAILARWSHERSGLVGLLIVMALFAFSPNLLASATLATTDLVATVTFLAALYALWNFWQRPSFGRWLAAGLTLGLAISAKLTGLLTLPITLVLCYSQLRRQPWWRPGLIWLSLLPLAGLVLWATYGFEVGRLPGIPLPLPAPTFLNNFVEVQEHIERGHYAFLMGERSNTGWYHYFGVAYLIKTPVITLLLLAFSILYLTWQHKWKEIVFFWFPALVLFLAASYTRLNIGYRHILPLVPLAWLLISETAPFWQKGRFRRYILVGGLLLYAGFSVKQMPHYLAYFNEFIGGSSQGYRYLGDSNIDWGQDLPLLAEYVKKQVAEPLYVSYFGAGDMGYYGLDNPPLFDEEGQPIGFSPANPAPGRYVISANHLQGATAQESDLFAKFRRMEPVGNLGYSILVFDVPNDVEGSWIAHCLDPIALVDEVTAEKLVGRSNLRQVYFDCNSNWVLPGEASPGWYILPLAMNVDMISSILAHDMHWVYANQGQGGQPGYQVYYWAGSDTIIDRLNSRVESFTYPDGRPVSPPIAIDLTAQFLGGFKDGRVWGSIWQTGSATGEPLSVLLHLYAEEPNPEVADGLGFQPAQWQPGDIFIQYHNYGEIEGIYLETGLYNFTNGERLPFNEPAENYSSILIYPKPGSG